jgi:hypothetical protein
MKNYEVTFEWPNDDWTWIYVEARDFHHQTAPRLAVPCSSPCLSSCSGQSKAGAIVQSAKRTRTKRLCGTRWRLTLRRSVTLGRFIIPNWRVGAKTNRRALELTLAKCHARQMTPAQ